MSLTHPLLVRHGVDHGFGTRDDAEPEGLLRPRQVHGRNVAFAEACRAGVEADAVVAKASGRGPGAPVGVVTADCVPVLVAARGAGAVAAIHAGWRGLAAGVVPAAIEALRRVAGGAPLVAAIGPHIAACCYEVDAPVLDALRYFGADLDAATCPTRPGHHRLDLGALTRAALQHAGVGEASIGSFDGSCTSCDAQRFHSYRRDGARSGRLVHWVRTTSP